MLLCRLQKDKVDCLQLRLVINLEVSQFHLNGFSSLCSCLLKYDVVPVDSHQLIAFSI